MKSQAKRPVGRPPKYATPKATIKAIERYFNDCNKRGEMYSVSGLALALDISRMTLINYRNKNPEFRYVVTRARSFVEAQYERLLWTGTKAQQRGAIFALKRNFGWRG